MPRWPAVPEVVNAQPPYRTPGTRLTWRTAAEWLDRAYQLERRRCSEQLYRQQEAHIEELARHPAMLLDQPTADLQALRLFLGRPGYRPPRGLRGGTAWTFINEQVNNAIQRYDALDRTIETHQRELAAELLAEGETATTMSIRKTIEDETVEFRVSESGRFIAQLGEELGEVSDTTLDGAVEAARKLLKKKHAGERKPIDVTILGIRGREKGDFYGSGEFSRGDGAIDFILRGHAGRTSELLLTRADGSKQKTKADVHAFGEKVVRRLTADEHAEYERLTEAVALANRAVEQFTAARLVNWREHFEVGVRK